MISMMTRLVALGLLLTAALSSPTQAQATTTPVSGSIGSRTTGVERPDGIT
jgi:hypothetical protein